MSTDTDADGAGDWYEIAATYTNPNSAAEKPSIPYPLPDPVSTDTGNPTKPVKVYIMSGQSNMVGIGYVSGGAGSLDTITKQENKFPNFVTASNAWTKRNDVIYKGVVTATGHRQRPAGPWRGWCRQAWPRTWLRPCHGLSSRRAGAPAQGIPRQPRSLLGHPSASQSAIHQWRHRLCRLRRRPQ